MRSSSTSRPPQSGGGGNVASLALLMVSVFACFYTAGRLWQDAEMRHLLLGASQSLNNHQAKGSISVEETLKLLDCKKQQKTLADAELKLAAAKSQGYASKSGLSSSAMPSNGRLHAVVGIMTSFSGQSRRASARKTWMPTGSSLKELEVNKGIIVRYVVGRSSNRGDMLDRQIDQESGDTKDFLILGEHVESEDDMTHKSKLFFSTAVETWEADFYLKVEDNIALSFDMLDKTLSNYRDKLRVYLGCMKSGEVVSDPNANWYEPDWWKFGDQKSQYHRHAAGQIYALSRSLAQYISINSAYLKEYKNEDVAVGAWMLGVDTEHVDDRNLCCASNTGGVCWLQ